MKAGSGTPQALDVSGGIAYQTGFNLNGIVAKGSHRLVVVQTNAAKLFRIDLNDNGDAIDEIDEIEGVSLAGDGMILDRGKLVVVTGNPAQLNFVKLKDGASRAELRGTQASDKLHGPSTVTRAKNLYLVVNADFARSASHRSRSRACRAGAMTTTAAMTTATSAVTTTATSATRTGATTITAAPAAATTTRTTTATAAPAGAEGERRQRPARAGAGRSAWLLARRCTSAKTHVFMAR